MTSTCPSFDDHIVPDAFSSVTRTKRSRDSSFSSVFSEEELFSNCKRSKHEDEFPFNGPPSADSGIAFDLFSITDTTTSPQLQSTDPFCNLEPFASSNMNSNAPHRSRIGGGMQLIIQEQPEEVTWLAHANTLQHLASLIIRCSNILYTAELRVCMNNQWTTCTVYNPAVMLENPCKQKKIHCACTTTYFTCVISPVYSTIVPAMKVRDTEDHWKDSMNATHQCG